MTNNRAEEQPVAALARIRAGSAMLGPSEQRVARVIAQQPEAIAEWSTAELAAAAGTSPATVIRACQNLGFRGYQHLRLELARSAPEPPVEGAGAIDDVFDAAADAVVAGKSAIDRDEFARAADAIVAADRVLLVGTGFSAPPAQDAAMRLLTAGVSAEAPPDVLAQQFAARTLDDHDVCIAVSYSGANVHTLQTCRAAKAGGATVIAVTSFTRSPLTRLADVLLATGSVRQAHDVDPFLGRIGQSLILHALHEAVLAHPGSTVLLDRMRDVVADALADEDPLD